MIKKIATLLSLLLLTTSAIAQTLNVKTGNVTYKFPSPQTGEMTYVEGKTVTIMGKDFTICDIDEITIDDTNVKDNSVVTSPSTRPILATSMATRSPTSLMVRHPTAPSHLTAPTSAPSNWPALR